MVATVALQIDRRMLEKINRRLRKLPADFAPVMDRALDAVEGRLRAETGPLRDTGDGSRAFQKSRPQGRAFDLEGTVTNKLIYMAVLDVGRTPGAKGPPPAALAGWARRHGWGTDERSLRTLSYFIGKRGHRGRGAKKWKGYVKRALKDAKGDINNIIAAWARGLRW